MTLFGWDASDFDWSRGPMDLAAAKADGIVFFTHKATEGTSTKHVHTGEALRRARDAGFEFIGAYHVVRSSPTVTAQVAYFLAYLDACAPWWRDFPGFFLQVDLELWSYDAVSAATGAAFTRALLAAQPKQVILYASRGQYGDQFAGATGIPPLWNASYGANPIAHYPNAYPGDGSPRWNEYSGQVPAILQYGSQTTIGSQPVCDANAFRGTLDQLRALLTKEEAPDMTPEQAQHFDDMIWRIDAMNAMSPTIRGGAYINQPCQMVVDMLDIKTKVNALVAGGGGGGGGLDPAAVADLKAEIRDAVADLGEGGAAQVRADPDA